MACPDCHLYQNMNDHLMAMFLEREQLVAETLLHAIESRDIEIAAYKAHFLVQGKVMKKGKLHEKNS